MSGPRKSPPRRKLKGSAEGWDRIARLSLFHRVAFLGTKTPRDDSYPVIPEPDEELEDSELSEGERRSAVARERMRRDGMQ